MRLAFKDVAKLFKRFKPKRIMEIGSNDGILKNFNKKSVIAEPCKI